MNIFARQFMILFVFLFFNFYPTIAQAKKNDYPLSSRSIFLTGCLTDKPPNYKNDKEVYAKMRTCLCLLDKFQENYTNEQFMKLFSQPNKNKELESFVKKHILACL